MFSGPNKLREKLEKGESVIGTVIYSWSPNIMEVAGLAGLDFVRIDCEHAWRQDASAEHLMRAAAIADVIPILRIDRGSSYLPMKAFEIGAGGIIAIDVNTREDAEKIVKDAKFPPLGSRGYSGQNWSGGWGAKAGKEWVEWSDRELMVGVMIETTEAIKNLEEIISVQGLDFVYFGPADYSMSLGLRGPERNHPDVQEALKKTIMTAQKYGKNVMFSVGTNLDQIKKYKEMGITMFEISSDIAVLRSVWNETKQIISEMA